MQRILILNLMRMGDILQSTPLVAALRARHPGARVDLVLNEAFLDVGRRVDVDRILPFPVRELRQALAESSEAPRSLRLLGDFLEDVNASGPYDLVHNLTPSPSASSLGSLIPAGACRGMWLEDDGTYQTTDPWTSYLVAMMSNRPKNPFHLVDIWLRSVGERGPARLFMRRSRSEAANARNLLRDEGVRPEEEALVGFQVCASQQEKCWSQGEFVRLGRALARLPGVRVLLFGTSAEAARCGAVAAAVPDAVNLAGKTGLGELGAILERCRFLVSNDTGTVHVATAVGTPVIVVSVGPVLFRETGPYGRGHWVFQARLPCVPCHFNARCLRPVCKETIRAEHVHALGLRLLRGEDASPPRLPAEVCCYRSDFDDDGLLLFATDDDVPEDRTIGFYRDFWLSLLEDRRLVTRGGSAGALPPATLEGWGLVETHLRRCGELVEKLHAAGREGNAHPERWKILRENLRETEQRLRETSLKVQDLSPLVHYVLMRREAASHQEPLAFLESAASLYRGSADRVREGLHSLSTREKEKRYGNP